MMKNLVGIMWIIHVLVLGCSGNPDAKRLYDDLLSNYNKLVRPVINVTDALTVKIKLKLSQLIDVNLKNQIMTTNLWVEQAWYDYKLKWDPKDYGGVEMLHVPSDHIWRPDIVLYNNADGNFEVTLATKATLNYTGRVDWKPPAIYKSSCEIDVEYFPFDEQTCVMKFGSWTYDGFQVDLRHLDEIKGSNVVDIGIDLTEFYTSVEWDILEVPAVRNEKFYTCCDEPYLDITFNITMRRKTLFYTVNLIIPCMGISFLTVLVFYLPSDSGEKVSLSISILLSLTVFFLLLAEIIPPTSLVVPLLGKFVLFTMILDTFSICVTVVVLNVHFRSPQTHVMAPWVRRVFIHILPRLLVMRRPHYQLDSRRRFSIVGVYHTPPIGCRVQEIVGNLGNMNFKATNGWICRWENRSQLPLKKIVEEANNADVFAASTWRTDLLPSLIKNYELECVYIVTKRRFLLSHFRRHLLFSGGKL
ncbi:acetylcholine receptor subunit alpha-like isoform X2 [Diabrotica virgifera virgifera]|uniref:Acetylcholine receptor subunit alpha-like n=1 Tax=Diabrotica virgifera virgifera TaxID=50390 RepID=A0ABM5JYC3_DIAVI|nr:acetylcholine receptor subunit alpha-like isoform X2 [Diabrotica virgifera virgifera]